MTPICASFLLGIGAGIGVVLVVLNLRGLWGTRPGARCSNVQQRFKGVDCGRRFGCGDRGRWYSR
jgi:hypothetical protein